MAEGLGLRWVREAHDEADDTLADLIAAAIRFREATVAFDLANKGEVDTVFARRAAIALFVETGLAAFIEPPVPHSQRPPDWRFNRVKWLSGLAELVSARLGYQVSTEDMIRADH